MTTEVQQPNPVDQVRDQIQSALDAEKFNGATIMIRLDRLEKAHMEVKTSPVDIFTELASHAIAARDVISTTDRLQGEMFHVKAENYTRTAELLMASQTPVSLATETKPPEPDLPETELEAGRSATVTAVASTKKPPTRTSRPTNTSTLPSMGSAKR